MSFACFNLQGIKRSEIAKLTHHNTSSNREKLANVDSSRTPQNIEHGTKEDVLAALPSQDQAGRKIRKDARVAAALLFQASPGWNGKPVDLWKCCQKFMKKNLTGKIAHMAYHADEKTPHFHVLFIPKDENGRANFRDQFGGPKKESAEKLRRLHDRLAEETAPLGLERGIRGSDRIYGKGSRREREVRMGYEAIIQDQEKRIAELEEILEYNASLETQGGAQRPSMTETRATHAPARRAVPEHGANRGRD